MESPQNTSIELENSIIESLKDLNLNSKIENKGTGAGGAGTNKNGLPYEELTDLRDKYVVNENHEHFKQISFNLNPDKAFSLTKQSHLFKHMREHADEKIPKAHGAKNPDECYIDENDKRIFIIEKKFQQSGGSVCEKIQTPDFKIWQYSRTFPAYDIIYMYCLSDWFKINCIAELEYLDFKKIPVFWGNDKDYKDKIVEFIVNYK